MWLLTSAVTVMTLIIDSRRIGGTETYPKSPKIQVRYRRAYHHKASPAFAEQRQNLGRGLRPSLLNVRPSVPSLYRRRGDILPCGKEIRMEQYAKLTEWLNNPQLIVMTFDQIEEIIGDKLPDSAAKYRHWWGNEK